MNKFMIFFQFFSSNGPTWAKAVTIFRFLGYIHLFPMTAAYATHNKHKRRTFKITHTNNAHTHTYTYTHTYIYIYIYTGCDRRNGPDFGRVFLMLNYTEKPQNTYIQS